MTPAALGSAATPAAPPALGQPRGGRLGTRLGQLLALCPAGGPVADVGSGHGRLARELKRHDPRRPVYATEINPGPAAELRRLLGPHSGVLILEGDGLQPLDRLDCRGVIIAGMGGATIARILERGEAVTRRLEWLCLQPAQRADRLLDWLTWSGWSIKESRLIQEKRHHYPTLLVAPR
ncbi:MAG TPA: tRNA (adenine(22)-N(1))-methyltransferase TrmK [Candidatus Dormibacteraeota bacterium]|nr:tRNA (adenine(22)-N(1))-methyltransferase TrmK [Candidatus Dormibacteraeota bacterium]